MTFLETFTQVKYKSLKKLVVTFVYLVYRNKVMTLFPYQAYFGKLLQHQKPVRGDMSPAKSVRRMKNIPGMDVFQGTSPGMQHTSDEENPGLVKRCTGT